MSLFLTLFLLTSLPRLSQAPCVANANAPALDHVVLVVRDLDIATMAFRAQGFRIKRGRLHSNNLLNRHIKFRDGSSLEMMSLAGPAGDTMAQDYERLLKEGEGGVYAALSVPDVGTSEQAGTALRLQSRRSSSGPWQFLSFPPASPAAAIFFVAGRSPVLDPDSLVAHRPDVEGLGEVWLEGGPALSNLLRQLGARFCGPARSREGQLGERWALRRGYLVVVPRHLASRPRVLGVVLQSRKPVQRAIHPLPGFWIDYHN